jgi:glutamate-ammonia-ligase adenylyltransferase
LQHRLRLDGAEKTRISIEAHPEMLLARDAVVSLWKEVFRESSNS